MNASAGPNGLIVVNRGIVEYATNEDEVAMVIAHEIGHQAADHVATGQRNQAVGSLVGAVLLGALGAAASYGSGVNVTNSAVQAGATIGGRVGRISYSKEQEREADYIAALILYRSGIDPEKARGFLVTMARASGRKETGMLDGRSGRPRARRRLGPGGGRDPRHQRAPAAEGLTALYAGDEGLPSRTAWATLPAFRMLPMVLPGTRQPR